MKIWPFLYSLQFETGVIRAGVNGAGVKKGPALKGAIRYVEVQHFRVQSEGNFFNYVQILCVRAFKSERSLQCENVYISPTFLETPKQTSHISCAESTFQ